MHTGKTDCPWSPANKVYRNSNITNHIQYFTQPKDDMFFRIHLLQGSSMYFPAKIFIEIHYKYPGKGRNRIYQYDVNMLKPVSRYPFLSRTVSHYRALRNIIIHPIYIRVGMMNNIMLEFPDE